ncbi:divergent polysaccharide deacetylase family protein [Allorhizobium undicola]|uniref:divergent polysaccharide deacetylase family protein n=1 Tax=Allorhizobium undicola TaxID=78527 RepID=UPI003D33F233
MGVDLHAPLGQNRPPRRRKRLRWGVFLPGLAALVAIVGLSAYAALQPLGVKDVASLTDPGQQPQKASVPDRGATPSTGRSPAMRAPLSGAQVERSTMADGSVVTTFKPTDRTKGGPALIAASRIGQEPRMAAIPNPDLIENSAVGPLPIIGPDGLRPVEQYARPWSGAHGTRIAIIVGGMGLSQTGTQKAIKLLPEEVTLAFAASGNSLNRWMQEARRAGHEILLQVPMEPIGYPANDPGRGTLQVGKSAEETLTSLHRSMASVTNYTGIINYMGGRFMADAAAFEPVLRELAGRGLLFIDDGSSAQSLSESLARTVELPHAIADLQIDDQLKDEAILKRLDELERIAKRNGAAIGVASAFDESIAAITKWTHEAKARGIEIVGVSALALENGQ